MHELVLSQIRDEFFKLKAISVSMSPLEKASIILDIIQRPVQIPNYGIITADPINHNPVVVTKDEYVDLCPELSCFKTAIPSPRDPDDCRDHQKASTPESRLKMEILLFISQLIANRGIQISSLQVVDWINLVRDIQFQQFHPDSAVTCDAVNGKIVFSKDKKPVFLMCAGIGCGAFMSLVVRKNRCARCIKKNAFCPAI